MIHEVEIKKNGNTVMVIEPCTKKEAINYAKTEKKEDNQVFISGYNGQCTVYLNPNGNYEPVGKSW